MVTDPQTNTARPPVANKQTGPITIHCTAKLRAQCKDMDLEDKLILRPFQMLMNIENKHGLNFQ